jgi:cytochrome c5
MNKLSMIAAAFLLASGTAVLADDKPTDDEAAKIKEAVAAWGCEGGSYEKESEGTGVYEAEDVKCKAGQYDFRLDKDLKPFAITKD